MKRKQGLLVLVILAVSTIGISALASLLTYNINLTSNGSILTLQDPEGILILDLTVDPLWIGESGATFFRLDNQYPGILTVSMDVLFPEGYLPGTPEYGYKVDGIGDYIPTSFGDFVEIPEGSYLSIALNVVNDDAVVGVSVAELSIDVTT